MPFISKDWRSTGEAWVKFEGGWEMKKTLPRDHNERMTSSPSSDVEKNYESVIDVAAPSKTTTQPFCPITIRNSREIAGFNNLTHALLRLDFRNAVRDVRRFDYVSKLLAALIVGGRLSQLSGGTRKVIFKVLYEMAEAVAESRSNEHVLRQLLIDLKASLSCYSVWGGVLGSSSLFKQHQIDSDFLIDKLQQVPNLSVNDVLPACSIIAILPEECLREIVLRLSDASDIDRIGDSCCVLRYISKEPRIWRELMHAHFNQTQIDRIISDSSLACLRKNDSRKMYNALRRRYGLRENFTELLALCRLCGCLFWQSTGHPCRISDSQEENIMDDDQQEQQLIVPLDANHNTPKHVPITPLQFLAFFSV